VSRKRGKKQKPAGEAIPQDILAEGSGPVASVATVEDVATTDDIATTEDVVTPDDVVAEPAAPVEPAPAAPRARGKRRGKRGAAAADEAAAPANEESTADVSEDGADIEIAARNASELNNAELAALIGDAVAVAPLSAETDEVSDDVREPADGEVAFAAGEDRETGDPGEGGEGDSEPSEGDEDGQVVFPTSAASMDSIQLKHLVEALIFASDKPLTVQRLRQLTRVGDTRRLELALTELAEDYRERGVVLQQVSGGYQFRTRTQFSAWVQQLIAGRPVRLSRAQLETLAIIAYRQPITRPEIDDIRGVDSTATLKLLIDRMLIRALGKREEVGRPTLYGTTKEFLDFFSLGDLRELPTLREYSELTAESRKVMSDRLGIPVDGDDGSGGGSDDDGSGGGSDGGGRGGSDGGAGGGGGSLPDSDDGAAPDDAAHASSDLDAMASFFAAADAVDRSDADDEAAPTADVVQLADDPSADDDDDESVTDAGKAFLVDEPVEAPVAAAELAAAEPAVEPVIAIDPDADATQAFAMAEAVGDSPSDEASAPVIEFTDEPGLETAAPPDGQVSADGWPAGSQPVAVVAPINIHPVEPPPMDPHALDHPIDASSLDPAAGEPGAPHGDPVAE
jgi:segregation and condensation protein B